MFAARKLLTTVTTATKSNASLRPAATPSTINQRDFTITVNAKYIPGLAVHLVRKMLLNTMPHTMCRMMNREEVLEAVTLSIPGTTEIKKQETTTNNNEEEGDSIRVFQDLKFNDSELGIVGADVDNERNALFFSAHILEKDNSSSRFYSSRVNLEKNTMYNCVALNIQDGDVMATLQKI